MSNQNNPVKSSQSESNGVNQKGNAFLIIAIIVGVVAIGATGFASWKYFGGGSELEKEKSTPSYLLEEKTIPQIEKQEEIKKEEIISSKKTDETADWEIYQNKKYGYEIKYPKDCFYGPMPEYCKQKPPEGRPIECLCALDDKNPDITLLQSSVGFNNKKNKLIFATFIIYHYNLHSYNPPAGTDLVKWLKEHFSHVHQNIPNKPNTKINGISAVKIYTPEINDPQSPPVDSYEDIYFIRNNRIFHISMIDVDNAEIKKLYNQMLSTFKFIKADETADLETYEKDTFSLKYSSEIWSLKNNRLFHKEIGDSCMIVPGALWRQSLIKIVESINTTFNNYKARQVKLGTENEISTINIYFDENLPSKEFSLSLPKDKQDKQTCENDFKEVISTIEFEE